MTRRAMTRRATTRRATTRRATTSTATTSTATTSTATTSTARTSTARARPLLRLLRLARPLRGQLLLAVAAGAATTGCGVALLAVSGFLLARASLHPGIVAISVAVVAVRALSVGRAVSRYTERLAVHDAAFTILASLRVRIYTRLERLAPAGLPAFRSGDLLARLVSDVDASQDLFIRGITPPLAAALAGAGAVAAATLILAPGGALLGAGLLAGGVAVPLIAAAAARDAARALAPARGELAAACTSLLDGAAELRAFGAQDQALASVVTADAALAEQSSRGAAVAGLSAGLGTAVSGLTLWGVLLLGVAATAAGVLTRVPLAVLTLTALAAFEAVTELPAAAVQLARARAAARRIGAVLDAPPPVREPAVPRPVPPGPLRLALRDVRVRYQPGGPLALAGLDLDLDLAQGRRVALVGPAGAGKSTVAAVLLRFVEPSGGCVTLNGHDLAGYAAAEVRTRISGCPQDPHIFAATIAENLRLARPGASLAQLAAAADQARLLDWIEALPRGWDTQAGAGGAALSGGQRQRLALARALLADPDLLILDEPTVHLDRATARALIRDLVPASTGRAVLLITHDPAGLELMDEIVVLDRGRVTERGSHGELIRAGRDYRRMWQASQPRAGPG
ncbi:MAG TPA: thiol reductant ABC exporter subunit CydC [Streptosporangiaceae bacterium]|jgi:thiol reductant ABC exporter CydC subunit